MKIVASEALVLNVGVVLGTLFRSSPLITVHQKLNPPRYSYAVKLMLVHVLGSAAKW